MLGFAKSDCSFMPSGCNLATTGNIDLISEVGNPANDQSYGYDALYRLTDYNGLINGNSETHVYNS